MINATIDPGTTVLLRPLAFFLNRQPIGTQSEIQTCYWDEVTCPILIGNDVHTYLLRALTGDALLLRALRRAPIDDISWGRWVAEVVAEGRSDRQFERVVSGLSREPGTRTIDWRVHVHAR